MVSGDLDEFAIAGLAAAPVDAYGVGTSVVIGSGVPTAGLVYKLVEVDGRPVAKRSEQQGQPTAGASRATAGTGRPAPPPRRSWCPARTARLRSSG